MGYIYSLTKAIMYVNILKDYKKFNEYSIRGNFKDENGEVRPRPEKPAKPSVLETDDFQR